MYRVWDNKEKVWVRDIFLSPNNDLWIKKRTQFGNKKLSLVPDGRYKYQLAICETDINGIAIYEGDICKTKDGKVGLIAYAPEKVAYLFFDYNNYKYYQLDKNICNTHLEIIGNIFETPELIPDLKEDKNESSKNNK